MRRATDGDYAWIAIGVGVLVYDLLAREDELLSEAADRYMGLHPWLWRAAVLATALHVTNAIPEYLDIFHLCRLRRASTGPGVLRVALRHVYPT